MARPFAFHLCSVVGVGLQASHDVLHGLQVVAANLELSNVTKNGAIFHDVETEEVGGDAALLLVVLSLPARAAVLSVQRDLHDSVLGVELDSVLVVVDLEGSIGNDDVSRVPLGGGHKAKAAELDHNLRSNVVVASLGGVVRDLSGVIS